MGKLHPFAGLAALLLALLPFAVQAKGDTASETFYEGDGWTGVAFQNGEGATTGCEIRKSVDGGRTKLSLGAGQTGVIEMTLHYPPGQLTGEVDDPALFVDDFTNWQWMSNIDADEGLQDESIGPAKWKRVQKFLDRFANGGAVRLVHKDKEILSVDLGGSKAAVKALRGCLEG